MAHMMQDLQLQGTAESGYGVRIIGFHSASTEFAKRLAELVAPSRAVRHIAQCETNGFQMFLISESYPEATYGETRVATFRREPHRFFPDLAQFLRSTQARHIQDMVVSESFGSITLTLLYVPTLSQEEPGV